MTQIWLSIISAVVILGGAWLAILRIREGNRIEDNAKRLEFLEKERDVNLKLIEALKRQNALLRYENNGLIRLIDKYVKAAHESLIVTDESGIVTEWDASATLMFGYGADEAIGKDVSSLIVPPELRQHHRRAMSNVFKYKRQPRAVPLTVKANTKAGDQFDAQIQLLPAWETGDGSGSWRYGARITKLDLTLPTDITREKSEDSDH